MTNLIKICEVVSWVFTSNGRSCLTAHTQIPIETTDMNINGINTKIHRTWIIYVQQYNPSTVIFTTIQEN
jgi:hypothetical protein